RSKIEIKKDHKRSVLSINGSEILREPVLVGKSVIYLVARPLDLPHPIVKKMKLDESLSGFVQALTKTGLSCRLSDAHGVTVFAPSTAAWDALGVVKNYLMLDTSATLAALEAIARYGIVENILYTQDVKSGRTVLSTSEGGELILMKNGDDIYVGEGRLELSTQVGGRITELSIVDSFFFLSSTSTRRHLTRGCTVCVCGRLSTTRWPLSNLDLAQLDSHESLQSLRAPSPSPSSSLVPSALLLTEILHLISSHLEQHDLLGRTSLVGQLWRSVSQMLISGTITWKDILSSKDQALFFSTMRAAHLRTLRIVAQDHRTLLCLAGGIEQHICDAWARLHRELCKPSAATHADNNMLANHFAADTKMPWRQLVFSLELRQPKAGSATL
ncbi:hypothetical protein EC968_009110, partial [Mortierella alpina]